MLPNQLKNLRVGAKVCPRCGVTHRLSGKPCGGIEEYNILAAAGIHPLGVERQAEE